MNKFTLAAGAASLLLLAGCVHELDMKALKTLVTQVIAPSGATIKSINCPDKREMKAGDTFECTADIDTGKVTLLVTQKDGKGMVSVKLSTMILPGANFEKLLVDAITPNLNEGEQAKADCGAKFRPAIAKDSFDCAVKVSGGSSGGGASYQVKFTLKDDKGAVTYFTPDNWPAGQAQADADADAGESDEGSETEGEGAADE